MLAYTMYILYNVIIIDNAHMKTIG